MQFIKCCGTKKKIPHCQFGKLLLVAKKVMSDMDFDEN